MAANSLINPYSGIPPILFKLIAASTCELGETPFILWSSFAQFYFLSTCSYVHFMILYFLFIFSMPLQFYFLQKSFVEEKMVLKMADWFWFYEGFSVRDFYYTQGRFKVVQFAMSSLTSRFLMLHEWINAYMMADPCYLIYIICSLLFYDS